MGSIIADAIAITLLGLLLAELVYFKIEDWVGISMLRE